MRNQTAVRPWQRPAEVFLLKRRALPCSAFSSMAMGKRARDRQPSIRGDRVWLKRSLSCRAFELWLAPQYVVDRTNRPFPERDRKFSITSALSIAAHTEGATPNNRVASGLVNWRPGISRYCSRTRCSNTSSGEELGGMVIMAAYFWGNEP